MKRYTLFANAFLLCLLILLPSCIGFKKKEKVTSFVSSSEEQYDIESVYKKQSLKEAAFSAIRQRVVDVCIDAANDTVHHIVKKLEARCADIPVLINARPLHTMFMQAEDGDLCMAYETMLPLDQVGLFYQREMERSGWQQEAQLHGVEIMLVYKKPDKIAIISLRSPLKKSQKNRVIITQMHSG